MVLGVDRVFDGFALRVAGVKQHEWEQQQVQRHKQVLRFVKDDKSKPERRCWRGLEG